MRKFGTGMSGTGAGLAILGFALASSTAAQDLSYSNRATEECLSGSASGAEMSDCIGASATACMEDTPGGFSTVGMGGCIDRELSYWDARLNDVYGEVRAEARELDRDKFKGAPSQADALRDMQRAWIAFRDATCAYEASQWGGGTGAGPAFLGCLMRLSGEQTLYLESSGLGG